MAGIKSINMFLIIAIVLVAALAPHGEAVLGCGQVIGFISPCLPYVTRNAPLGTCCNGVRGLYGAARSTPDRQSVCNCLKSVSRAYSGSAISKAAGLPGRCGVRIPYKISPSTDCSRVR